MMSLAEARFIVRLVDEDGYAWAGTVCVTRPDGSPYRFQGKSFPAKMIASLVEQEYMFETPFMARIVSREIRMYTPSYEGVLQARAIVARHNEKVAA